MIATTCRNRWAIAASVTYATLILWVLYETRYGDGLGLAERATVVGETLWPLWW